jgi:hypothetical protein
VACVPEPEVVFDSLLQATAHIAAAWTVRPEERGADSQAADTAAPEASTTTSTDPSAERDASAG